MNFSNASPSHWLQFFMNCSSMIPSHGVQSLRYRLLQHGSQVCQQSCSSVGSSLFTSPQVLPGACSSTGFLWGLSVLQVHPPASVCGPPQAAGGCLLHPGTPWAAGGQPASPRSSRKLQENLCSSTSVTSSPSLFADLGVCRVISLTYSHSSLLDAVPQ